MDTSGSQFYSMDALGPQAEPLSRAGTPLQRPSTRKSLGPRDRDRDRDSPSPGPDSEALHRPRRPSKTATLPVGLGFTSLNGVTASSSIGHASTSSHNAPAFPASTSSHNAPVFSALRPPSRSGTPLDPRVINLPDEEEDMSALFQGVDDSGARQGDQKDIDQDDDDPARRSAALKKSLPQRDLNEEINELALAKLEHLKKYGHRKRKWLQGTPAGEFMYGKTSAKGGEGTETPSSESGFPSASGSAADLADLDQEAGVKLGIQSLPGYTVMARGRGAASKAKSVVKTVPSRALALSPLSGSPRNEEPGSSRGEESDEEQSEQQHKARRGSLSDRFKRFGSMIPTQRSDQALRASSLAADTKPDEGVQHTVELQALHEEVAEESTSPNGNAHFPQSRTDGESKSAAGPSRIPTLHIQEASEPTSRPGLETLVEGPSRARPERSGTTLSVKPTAERRPLTLGVAHSPNEDSGSSRTPSFLGGDFADEPEGMVDDSTETREELPSITAQPSCSTQQVSSTSESDEESAAADTTTVQRDDDSSEDSDVPGAQLSLHHADPLTNRQLRRQLKRDKALSRDDNASARALRAATLGHKVSRGLHYATSESRNRRAMEKYTPHPGRTMTGYTPRTSSPALESTEELASGRRTPGRSLTSGFEGGLLPGFTLTNSSSLRTVPTAGSRRGSLTGSRMQSVEDVSKAASPQIPQGIPEGIVDDVHDDATSIRRGNSPSFLGSPAQDAPAGRFHIPHRWGTLRSATLNDAASVQTPSHMNAPRPWHFRQRRRWARGVADETGTADPNDAENAAEADPEAELDKILGKLAMEQAPEQVGEKFEWDVLYENQRGMLFFGIPKFSARTLMQWDPSAWTDIKFQDSPYNIVNAQLPDPSWEWVYPEWLIDMSGDVDESGWQYSGNFGRNPFVKMAQFIRPLPRPGPDGDVETNPRLKKREEKRHYKEMTREDDGLEALKRSIKAKGIKWTGRPDPGSFVRRRRWIRLRRRRPLDPTLPGAIANKKTQRSATPMLAQKDVRHEQDPAESPLSSAANSSSDSLSSELNEEDEVTSGSDEEDRPSAFATSSGFLPRKRAGHLRNQPDPLQPKHTRSEVRVARKRRRQFNGTLRELHNLLPSIVDPKGIFTAGRTGQELALSEIDARNPFIPWDFVKSRLNDDDMTWKTIDLRQIERRYQSRRGARNFTARHENTADTQNPDWSSQQRGNVDDRFASLTLSSSAKDFELTRDALVEINWARTKRVLKACRLDRQRLDLWRTWLGIDTSLRNRMDTLVTNMHPESGNGLTTDLASLRRSSNASIGVGSGPVRGGRRSSTMLSSRVAAQQASLPDANDIWDILERRLDSILLLFEFNSSRVQLLRVLLAIHNDAHKNHVYEREPIRLVDGESNTITLDAPAVLDPLRERIGIKRSRSPLNGHRGGTVHKGRIVSNPPGLSGEEWIASLTKRLQYYSDIQEIADSLEQHGLAHVEEEYQHGSFVKPQSRSSSPMLSHSNGSMFRNPFASSASTGTTIAPVFAAPRGPEGLPAPSFGGIGNSLMGLDQIDKKAALSKSRPSVSLSSAEVNAALAQALAASSASSLPLQGSVKPTLPALQTFLTNQPAQEELQGVKQGFNGGSRKTEARRSSTVDRTRPIFVASPTAVSPGNKTPPPIASSFSTTDFALTGSVTSSPPSTVRTHSPARNHATDLGLIFQERKKTDDKLNGPDTSSSSASIRSKESSSRSLAPIALSSSPPRASRLNFATLEDANDQRDFTGGPRLLDPAETPPSLESLFQASSRQIAPTASEVQPSLSSSFPPSGQIRSRSRSPNRSGRLSPGHPTSNASGPNGGLTGNGNAANLRPKSPLSFVRNASFFQRLDSDSDHPALLQPSLHHLLDLADLGPDQAGGLLAPNNTREADTTLLPHLPGLVPPSLSPSRSQSRNYQSRRASQATTTTSATTAAEAAAAFMQSNPSNEVQRAQLRDLLDMDHGDEQEGQEEQEVDEEQS